MAAAMISRVRQRSLARLGRSRTVLAPRSRRSHGISHLAVRAAWPAIRNVAKAWALLLALCAALGAIGWSLSGYRVGSVFVFSGLLLGGGAYWYADRVVMGMVGARELLPGEAPALHSTVERLSLRAGVVKPRLHVIPDGFPRALSAGRGVASSALALSTRLVAMAAPAALEG